MSRSILLAALASCALLSSVTVSADDRRHQRSWSSDSRHYDGRYDGRREGRRDYRRDNDHWDNRRDDRRWDHRNWDGRRGWAVPPGHRFYPDRRYRYYGSRPGFRYGWYGGRYDRYYYQPSYDYFPPYRGPHGSLIISVPLW